MVSVNDIKIVRKVQNNLDLGRSLLMKNKSASSNNESFEIEVLNIPITLTEEDARRFFLQYGKITSIALQPFTRRCFVSFSSEEAREKAVSMANGQTMGDR